VINTDIYAVVSHTVVKQFPDSIKLLPTIGGSLEPSLWDGIEIPILLQPHFGETPVYYIDTKSPSLTAFGVDSFTFEDINSVSANNWELGVSSCGVTETGCQVGILTPYVSGGDIVDKIDECGNTLQLEVGTSRDGYIDACLSVKDGLGVYNDICTTVSSLNFNSLEDPFALKQQNANTPYLEYMCQYDVKDGQGRGIVFGNTESEVSKLLGIVFGDGFTNRINEKILNFGSNIKNLDKSDTLAIDELGENLGVPTSGLSEGVPVEIQNLLKLASIKYEDLFGVESVGSVFNPENVGEQVGLGENVSAGELLFTKHLIEPESEYQSYTVRSKNVGDQLITGFLSGDDVYPLSSLDDNTTDYCFWRNTFEGGKQVNEIIDFDTIKEVPTKLEWESIIDKRIQYFLLINLLG
jgi:hypothetical protein